jgi:hypothetical protein
MDFSRFKPTLLWASGAATEFINGFIAGLGAGSLVGAGTGAVTANTSLGDGVSTQHQVLTALCSMVLSAAGNGCKRIIVWHDSHPFPNPYPPAA